MDFRLVARLMTLDDIELDSGRPPLKNVLKQHNFGCIQHRDMMFGSMVGFLGTADPMVQLSNLKIQDGSWWPSWIYKSGHNFAPGLPHCRELSFASAGLSC